MLKDLFRPILSKPIDKQIITDLIIGEHKHSYFDYTASGLAFEPIEERIMSVLQTYANTHSKEASMASLTQNYYEDARANIASSLGVGSEFAVLPSGCGATKAIKRFQEILGLYIPPATSKRFGIQIDKSKRPLVIVGPYEHHSNEVSYREALCETVRINLCDDGLVDLKHLKQILEQHKDREIIGSFCIASNVSGIITPYKKISKLLRSYGALVCFDAAASSPYINVDSALYDVMFLSPHKLLGGPGSCGLLIIKKELIDSNLPPTFAGGGTVEYVSRTTQRYTSHPELREDAGTPGILQLIRASLSYQLRNEIGLEWIKDQKRELLEYLRDELQKIDGSFIYGNIDVENIGIVSFNIKNQDPYAMCAKLSDKFGLQTRAGCSCAGPYGHDLLGVSAEDDLDQNPGWLRISLHFSQTKKDIDFLIQSLKHSL